jgi:hypothetical protein
MEARMSRYNLSFATTLLLLWTTTMQAGGQESELKRPGPTPLDSHSLDWEAANAKRMFILVSDGDPISAISVDTTHIEDLHAGLKLQELVFRIGGARMPIVDKQFVKVRWGMIHINWDHFPATQRKHPFEISMRELEDTNVNPHKQIIIFGGGRDVDRAVSAFTEAALGVPLKSLEDKTYKWERKKVVAIPEKMKKIYGNSRDR